MSVAICTNCTARYSIGLQKCPQCAAREPIEAWKVDDVKFTEQDIAERRQRVNDGVGTDEDRRLLKLYDKGGVQTVPEQQASPATPGEVTEVLDQSETYEGDEWPKDRLVEECRKRELAVSGNKDELAARLREFDETHPF